MTHTPHELAAEFPADVNLLHYLKQTDKHFAALAEDHHRINRRIHRIEIGAEPASAERLELLKKQRLAVLDEVASRLAEAARL